MKKNILQDRFSIKSILIIRKKRFLRVLVDGLIVLSFLVVAAIMVPIVFNTFIPSVYVFNFETLAKEMCDLILEGKADMVIGDRLSSTYFTENKRLFHNFGNKIVRLLINVPSVELLSNTYISAFGSAFL